MALSSTTFTSTGRRIRYRCHDCEVAWTGEDESACWMCGEQGFSLRAAFALREDDYLHLDFE